MNATGPDSDVMAQLSRHRGLSGAPRAEHEWLAARGRRWVLAAGDVLMTKGQTADALHIVFAGHFSIHVDRGAGSHKIYEWGAGDISGHLPFSRGAVAPNDIVAEEDTDILSVSDEHLPELIRECPSCTATMVHAMLDRARQFKQSDLHDEKLLSLGKLAAGLAHELNNPASAALRSAKLLGDTLDAAEAAATAIGVARLTEAQLAAISRVRTLCGSLAGGVGLSPIALADREDAIADWLAAHDANESCAGPLAESGVTLDALNDLAAIVNGPVLDAALRLISSGCVVRTLISEIKTATARIDGLVRSVKGFTFMDRAPSPEPVDIRQGIADTFTMLATKTRAKGVEVSVQFADALPRAHAVGAELNQVWMNLIDNALDAVANGGHVTVAAALEHGKVVVRITDDGTGIPADIKGRIFDPFFTTKEVGKGTGLGLDIVRRILQRHEGEIEVDSRPGHTEFRVVLPPA